MAAALFVVGQAAAQQTTESAIASPGSAAPLPEWMSLPLNKGELFALPSDARDVLVANTDIADVVIKTPRLAYVFARAVGDTNVFFLDADGGQILRLEIHVEPDLSSLRAALAKVMPGEDIEVMSSNENIILSGSVGSAQAAEDARLLARRFVASDDEIVNMLRIASDQQVLLKVKVAEMQRTAVKQLGFNAFIALGHPFSFLSGAGFNADAFSGGVGADLTNAADVARAVGGSINL